MIFCLKSNFLYSFSVGIHAPWVVVPWKQWRAWRNHQNKTKKPRVPRLWNAPPNTCTALLNGWEMVHCLLNYFQYSNVTLLEMFVLNTNCLNFDSVLAAYNFIFEKLPSVCKYKENADACSYPVLQLCVFSQELFYTWESFQYQMRCSQVFTHFLSE